MNERYDVVIIGGGVTGGAAACFLAREPAFGGSVLVVERDPTYQDAPSARSTGGFRQQFSTPENVRIGLFGAHFVKNAAEYLAVDGEVPDLGWREQGYLLLATARMLPVMQANNDVQRAEGADVRFHAPAALAERFPWLNTEGLAGGFLGASNEGWVDPWSLLQAYKRKARSQGVTYLDDEVVQVHRDGARVTGVTLKSGTTVATGAVINASGARSAARIAAQVGVDLPVEPRKRCTFVFECREPLAGLPPLTILPQGIAFRPEGTRFLCNVAPPPERDPVTDSLDIDHELFDDVLWPGLAERVPVFEAIKVVQHWACHYDMNTLDENVIVGRAPGLSNFYLANGFSGHGLQQSPAIGRALSELVTFGEYRALDLTRFGYERVTRGEAIPETNCY